MKDFKQVLETIKKLNEVQLTDFLVGILTPSELEQLIIRIKIVKMLKQGVPQHEIASKLGVGVATVSRGAKELKNGRFEYV